jgi:hypothetical protein
VQDVINQIKLYVESGKGVLAECASIEEFEAYGRFLTSKDIDHNGGTNNAADIVFNDVTSANAQIGDFVFEPEGGSLHNWQPLTGIEPASQYNDTVTRFTSDNTGWDYYVGGYAFGDPNNGYMVYLGGHKYASCGSQPTEENPEPNVAEILFEFDKNLFVDSEVLSTHALEFEFEKDIADESFSLLVKFHDVDNTGETIVNFTQADLSAQSGDPLQVDLTTVVVDNNKLKTLTFNNIGLKEIIVDSITVSWSGGDPNQQLRKITNKTTGNRLHDAKVYSAVELFMTGFNIESAEQGDSYTMEFNYGDGSTTTITFSQADLNQKDGNPLEVDLTRATISGNKLELAILRNVGTRMIIVDDVRVSWIGGSADQKLKKIKDTKEGETIFDGAAYSGDTVSLQLELDLPVLLSGELNGCSDNDDCEVKNIAGVRYVLNTLFNIKYQLSSREYVRAAPTIAHPYLYQGSFEYPNYRGHFRRYDVTRSHTGDSIDYSDWDTADGGIQDAAGDNGDTDARRVYTSRNVNGSWSITDFDPGNIDILRSALDVTPTNDDDSDEIAVIKHIRGLTWFSEQNQWAETGNKLGAIMHSAPAIVGSDGRAGGSRTEMAYVGDLHGMLHAVKTSDGKEQWAFIPSNLLGKLKNDRTDPNAVQDFAAVDASPTVKDVYYDHDDDGDKEWRTILAAPQGFGGTSIFALDVTDPTQWSVLWEATDTVLAGGGMGHANRVAIGKVKWPIKEVDDENGNGTPFEILDYEIKWVVFVATGYAQIAVNHGGIHVFAYDLKTASQLWTFSAEYDDAVNDIPGAVTTFDTDGDSFVDRVYVGDMNGRLWELDTVDGSNPNGTETIGSETKEIPLFNAGVGYPISVSPAIVKTNGHIYLVFGTGGTDWAADDQTYAIYALDASDKITSPTYATGAGTVLWQVDLAAGEKVWSTPTIANGYILVATAYGTMEGADPRLDVPAEGQASGNFYKLRLDGEDVDRLAWKLTDIGKVRGSIFVDRQHAYMTTIDGQIVQIGGEDFASGTGNRVVLRTWRQM